MESLPLSRLNEIELGSTPSISSESTSTLSSTTTTRERFRQSSKKIAAVLISGVGFLADAYDLFVIDFVVAILVATAYVEPTAGDKGLIVSSTLAGAVIGQLFFGVAADFLGRKIMFVITAFLVICGSVLSSLVGWGYTSSLQSFTVFHQLAICRFFLGCGIGGEYPLSATVASESETTEEIATGKISDPKGCLWYLSHKPNSIAAVFSMQGFGMLLSPLIVMLCIELGISLESTWRLCLGIGAIPSAIAFVFRWRMHETAAFKKAQRDHSTAESSATTATTVYYNSTFVFPSNKKKITFNPRIEEVTEQISVPTLSQTTFNHDNNTVNYHENVSNPVKNSHDNQSNDVGLKKDTASINTYTSIELAENFQNIPQHIPDKNILKDVTDTTTNKKKKSFRKHLKRSLSIIINLRYVLLGTSATWFLIDITLYGTGSFKSAIVATWFIDNNNNINDSIVDQTVSNSRSLLENIIYEDSTVKMPSKPINYDLQKTTPVYRPIDFHSIRSKGQFQRTLVENIIKTFRNKKNHEISNSLPNKNSSQSRLLQETTGNYNSLSLKDNEKVRENIVLQARMGAIVALLAIPGYILSLLFIHKIGTKKLQLGGFIAVAVIFIGLGIEQILVPKNSNLQVLELILFGLTFLCSNFGPNTTTFILPTQVYPTIVRATCHGFSAAMGKLGGVVGTSLFSIIERQYKLGWLLVMCGFVSIFGVGFTVLIPDDLKTQKKIIQHQFQKKKKIDRILSTTYSQKEFQVL